jgi:hypothetical protein
MAVGWLVELARHLDMTKGGDERTTATIDVDPALASTVSKQLGCEIDHG